MRLGEKLAYLREVAGRARGLGRPLSKAEVVRLMRADLGTAVSHAYLSQLENGHRIHLSAHTRELLARFFGVHPGYLVDDPTGDGAFKAHRSTLNDLPPRQMRDYGPDPSVDRLVAKLSNVAEPGRYLALFERLLDVPIEASEAVIREYVTRRPAGAREE